MKKNKTDESKSQTDSAESSESEGDIDSSENVHVDEYVTPVRTNLKKDHHSRKMTVSLPSLSKACDRAGVLDRAAAILATSVLHDLGLVTLIDRSKIIDRSRIRRERSKIREKLQQNDDQFNHTGIEGVFFDSRKD